MTKYYPIMLNIENKPCTVVGGGAVAERKVKSLLEYGAVVTVISPEVTSELKKLSETRKIVHLNKTYAYGDLKGSYLVYVATDRLEVSESCREEAVKEEILINVVDVPPLCDFNVPATIRRGALTIAIGTDGKSPMLSRKIREELEQIFGSHYEAVLNILGALRDRALKEIDHIENRKQLFHELIYNCEIESLGKQGIDKLEQEAWAFYTKFKSRIEGDSNA
ncbi:bifunctional precorrin-2 dehydrogenase/sirohydrochlorin ferrochelatase [Serpentinicella sp. ANB-PHB4]|uniref:precorrin-2 dehydrogenase/sirohydrochlorin ferrochelatase family protein n=1 Tax=Serpentinicella sp. ANB-PHB4 TaxID=3074076 RepID=UPI002859B8B9|nr:bifunctional precorrin-2 dehydrogenase/sirohydrochlorin ferrochelatase [Serpentinicella sp. ANB-PHB4]MDR5659664.1 bifunctional precorrin-2 dehydrogenase/sirohydrochlorin ferrochelatase [Serpentinicella sp. ANB-PHB4]